MQNLFESFGCITNLPTKRNFPKVKNFWKVIAPQNGKFVRHPKLHIIKLSILLYKLHDIEH
jgi:hypothetical protein